MGAGSLAQNPDVMSECISWLLERDSHPEKAETFESLILSLIPSEGGLYVFRRGKVALTQNR